MGTTIGKVEAALATSTTTLIASTVVPEAAINVETQMRVPPDVIITDALKEAKIVITAKWIAVATN